MKTKRRTPSPSSSPWQNKDPDLRMKAQSFKKKNERVLLTESVTLNSKKYFLSFYIPRKIFYENLLKILSPFLGFVIGSIILFIFLTGFSLWLILPISLIIGIVGAKFFIRHTYRVTSPEYCKKITGFTAFNFDKELIKDKEKLSELLNPALLALKLYFKPVITQEKIPEIQEETLETLKEVTEEGRRKLEEKEQPKTDLEEDLRELNEKLYQSDFKVYEFKEKLNDLKTEIHNLELEISEDLELRKQEYGEKLQEFRDFIEEYKEHLKKRINVYEKFQIKLEEKYNLRLRPSKLELLCLTFVSIISYLLSRAIESFIFLGFEALKYIFNYFAGRRALERSLKGLENIGPFLEEDFRILNGVYSENIELRC